MQLDVLLFNLLCKVIVKFSLLTHYTVTLFFWTENLFKSFNFVSDIIPDATLAIKVIAIAQFNDVFLIDDSNADATCYLLFSDFCKYRFC
jgi:hypothetical protein